MPISRARQETLPTDRITYTIGRGFRIPEREAPAIGEAFEALERKLRRAPTAADIVEAAKSSRSPFHKYVFDRTDAEAAYQYRLQRAQYVLQAIDVYLPQFQFTTRALIPDPATENGFLRTETALVERRDAMEAWSKRVIAMAQTLDEEYGHLLAMRTAPQSVKDFVAAGRVLAREQRPTATRAAKAT